MMLILISSMMMVMIIYMIITMMMYKVGKDIEMSTPYECGFDPYSLTRLVFSYRFYLISILFIIFDVEISLMLPSPYLLGSSLGMWIFINFINILIMGLLYEYYYGSLDWLNSIY